MADFSVNTGSRQMPDYSTIRTTASKAIRLKCLDCSGDQITEVRNCHIKSCALWRYRMGREQRDELYVRKPSTSGFGRISVGCERTGGDGDAD